MNDTINNDVREMIQKLTQRAADEIRDLTAKVNGRDDPATLDAMLAVVRMIRETIATL